MHGMMMNLGTIGGLYKICLLNFGHLLIILDLQFIASLHMGKLNFNQNT